METKTLFEQIETLIYELEEKQEKRTINKTIVTLESIVHYSYENEAICNSINEYISKIKETDSFDEIIDYLYEIKVDVVNDKISKVDALLERNAITNFEHKITIVYLYSLLDKEAAIITDNEGEIVGLSIRYYDDLIDKEKIQDIPVENAAIFDGYETNTAEMKKNLQMYSLNPPFIDAIPTIIATNISKIYYLKQATDIQIDAIAYLEEHNINCFYTPNNNIVVARAIRNI